MNGITLKDLGWNVTNYLKMDEQAHPEQPETEMQLCADERVCVSEEGQAWVKSDYTIPIEQ
jgi:hypothetical protein